MIKKYLFVVFIILVSLLFRLFINSNLQINNLSTTLLTSDTFLVVFFGQLNLILIFFIFQKLINYKVGLLVGVLYALSPWAAYLELSTNSYVILLTIVLTLYLLGELININKILLLGILFMGILGFLYKFNQVTIFSDVGLINVVNENRGETNQSIFAGIGKVMENRYIYLGEYFLFNFLKQFTPATYFTNQANLLGFSFSPPIFAGLIIPFLVGVCALGQYINRNKVFNLLLIGFLITPSVLSRNSPDLSRLILVAPAIFAITALGIYQLVLKKDKRIYLFLLFFTITFVSLQFLITLSDISAREPVRLERFK